jgi:hypothetical protein
MMRKTGIPFAPRGSGKNTRWVAGSTADITDARKVVGRTVLGVRFERSPKSSYRDGMRLARYHPGYYGEPIVANSYE